MVDIIRGTVEIHRNSQVLWYGISGTPYRASCILHPESQAVNKQYTRGIHAAHRQHTSSIRTAYKQYTSSIQAAYKQHTSSIRTAYEQHQNNFSGPQWQSLCFGPVGRGGPQLQQTKTDQRSTRNGHNMPPCQVCLRRTNHSWFSPCPSGRP